YPPQSHCPYCLSPEHEWVTLSGKGKIYSPIAYHRAWHPSWADRVPYNVSLVDLDEGGRLVSNVVGCPPEDVKCGMPVEVVFEDLAEYTLPKFRPVK
ncbi:MAG TPA: OB-fold domain-containing protein, partial [Candidatus Acidoferrales bacterium]|nr:OB-fold domain-containing protein [Candidatus Acidoferrales bacterium]